MWSPRWLSMAILLGSLTRSNAQPPSDARICTQQVSDGDAAVGIEVVTDLSCVSGGLGCFADVCRFCKVFESPQSTAFLNCSTFGLIPTRPVVKPVIVVVVSEPKPIDPLASPTSTKFCNEKVSDGDRAVGIRIVHDQTCATGGLGCLNDVCRFCRFETTNQSAAFVDCAQFGYQEPPILVQPAIVSLDMVVPPQTTAPSTQVCDKKVSDGDAAVGIRVVTDQTCLAGGVGCFEGVCRFCRATMTPQSAAFVDCASIGPATASPTVPPTAPPPTTSPPTSAPTPAPDATTHTPTLPPATVPPPGTPGMVCGQKVSSGDAAVGIDVVTDLSCVSGGVGCFEQVCRFCRKQLTTQSSPFVECASIVATPPPATTAPVTLAPPTQPSTQTPPVTTPAPTVSPGDNTIIIDENGGQPVVVTDEYCMGLISVGDKVVGISAYADRFCNDGGIGCFADTCRYCKLMDTIQARGFLSCSDRNTSGGTTSSPNDPIADPASQTQAILNLVKQWLHDDDVTESASAEYVITSPPPSRAASAEGSSSYAASGSSESGESMDSSQANEDDQAETLELNNILPEPELSPLNPTTTCTIVASDGDLEDGIISVTDRTCVKGGLGCFSDVCRFCKIRESYESARFYACSDVTEDGVQTTQEPLIIAKNCADYVSKGDLEAGISAVDDRGCSMGGLGCFAEYCRFCKETDTPLSTHFLECSSLRQSVQPQSSTESPAPQKSTSDPSLAVVDSFAAATELKMLHGTPLWLVGATAAALAVAAVVMVSVLNYRLRHPRRALAGQLQNTVTTHRPQERLADGSVLASNEAEIDQQAAQEEGEEQEDSGV